jgi:hypothetical protein
MPSEIENAKPDKSQRTFARLAGFLFLWVIVTALGGSFVVSHIAGGGTFPETAKRIAEAERLYRVGLSTVFIATFCNILLAFALYGTLKPFSSLLAQLAMIFSLADSFLGLVVRMSSFVRLQLYTSSLAAGAPSAEALSGLMGRIASATESLGGISFGVSLLLFFYLFLKSRYIPRVLSLLGLFASVIWIALYFANLIFPERHALFQSMCFPPMGLAIVLTGLYLMLFAVKIELAPVAAIQAS